MLRQIHDDLDAAVLAAYGWQDLIAPLPPVGLEEEAVLGRLVALNAERATEERRGLVRWLRPEFQNPVGAGAVQAQADLAAATPTAAGPVPAWPKTLPEQIQALRAALGARPGPAGAGELAQGFTRAPRAKVAELLETLAGLGLIRRLDDGRYAAG